MGCRHVPAVSLYRKYAKTVEEKRCAYSRAPCAPVLLLFPFLVSKLTKMKREKKHSLSLPQIPVNLLITWQISKHFAATGSWGITAPYSQAIRWLLGKVAWQFFIYSTLPVNGMPHFYVAVAHQQWLFRRHTSVIPAQTSNACTSLIGMTTRFIYIVYCYAPLSSTCVSATAFWPGENYAFKEAKPLSSLPYNSSI